MVWTPKFFAVQEEGLIANIFQIFERDFKEALDALFPIEAALDPDDPSYLPDFRERAWGQIVKNEFPCLAIGPNRTLSGDGPNEECIRQTVYPEIYIGVVDDSPENVTKRIMRYVNTAELVLRSASFADYSRDMSVVFFGFVLDEIEHVYGPIGQSQSALFRGAVLQPVFKFNEG